ncbi:M56 family metallopeptidase [Emticicia agri]|uniref:M56 family metallopeptidase n=1 Tax=Emticicia agri TaxID=2492393 RepID=A0A4Q5LV05_9BACT|nr:M56 family metallopeptidase [Emticicia agri]RYU93482.1 M56 family metallopeptidase [Emticicia agri]
MITLLLILLKFSLTIMVIWGFYKLFLEKLTFFVSNRFFFLGSIVIAFGVAVGHFDWLDTLFQNQMGKAGFGKYVPSTNLPSFNPLTQWLPLSSILLTIYAIGVIFLGINLGIQYFSYLKLKRSASLREINGQQVYVVSQDILPFSFSKSVFIAESAFTNPEIGKILLHESIHVQQNHSVDILLAEIVRIINWINPFAWLLKNSMRQNLEFLTDAIVINNGIDKKTYQYLLLHFSGNNPFNLVTNFNFYSLKTRISKMNQNKSNQFQHSRFLLFIPIVFVLAFVFSCMNEQITDVAPKPKEITIEPMKSKLKEHVLILDAAADNQLTKMDEKEIVALKSKMMLDLVKPDALNQSQFKTVDDVEEGLKFKESSLKLTLPTEEQWNQMSQKVKGSSKEAVEKLPPPPPPAPAKQ